MFYKQLCTLHYEGIICILYEGNESHYIGCCTQKIFLIFLSCFVSIEVEPLNELSKRKE